LPDEAKYWEGYMSEIIVSDKIVDAIEKQTFIKNGDV
jgi:hypothetical protein